VRCLCLVSNVTVSTAPGSSPGRPGSTEGGMGWQRDRRSHSAANATTAKNTASYCRRQQSAWRIFSIISAAIGFAALPGSTVPAPPRCCPPESGAEPPPCPRLQPHQPLCLSFPPAHRAVVSSPIPPPSSDSLHPTNGPGLPHSSMVCPALKERLGTRGLQGSHLRPGRSSPAQAAGGGGQRPDAMSWPRVTRRSVTFPPPCRGTSRPPPLLIPAGKAKEAAKLPCPAPLSRELSSLAPGDTSWHGLSAAAGRPGRQQGGLCQAAWALPTAGHNPSPKAPS